MHGSTESKRRNHEWVGLHIYKMNETIRKAKALIDEYEELDAESEEMSNDWEHGSPEAAATSDPSDQYMKGMEIEAKFEEIKALFSE